MWSEAGSGTKIEIASKLRLQFEIHRETYVPSGRRDSGITRSSVLGSTAMPAVVVLGTRSGLDIVVGTSNK